MSYRIFAKKGNRVISIPLEEKHKYFNITTSNGEYSILSYPNTTNANLYGIQTDKLKSLHSSNDLLLTQGTSADSNRIGDKVALKCIDYTFEIRFNIDTFIDYIPHGELADLWVNCRLMTVHFDEPKTPAGLADWFKRTFIYYADVSSSYLRQSCHQDMLRESSDFTGKFSILHDLKFKLNKSQGVHQIHYQLKPDMNLTFNNTSNLATNEEFLNTYTFLIGPIDYAIDTDPTTFHYLKNINSSYTLIYIGMNVKYTYYDLN